MLSPGAFTRQCSRGSSGRPSVRQPTGRREGVSSRMTNALKLGEWLQRSSVRSTQIQGLPPWKTPRAHPSRSMRTCPKWYPSTSQRITSCGSHQSSPAQQVRWDQRRWSYAIGSFASDVHLRSLESSLPDWMIGWLTPPPPWAADCALMACCLVALDKRPGVRPVGIGETLRRALAKIVMRATGDQAKTVCGNLQLCAGLEAGIEGATHTVGQRRLARVRER